MRGGARKGLGWGGAGARGGPSRVKWDDPLPRDGQAAAPRAVSGGRGPHPIRWTPPPPPVRIPPPRALEPNRTEQ